MHHNHNMKVPYDWYWVFSKVLMVPHVTKLPSCPDQHFCQATGNAIEMEYNMSCLHFEP